MTDSENVICYVLLSSKCTLLKMVKSRKTLAHRVIIGKVSSASFYRIVS